MGVRSGPCPWHSEGTEVRNTEAFRNMKATHCRRAFDKKLCPLTSLPASSQQVVQPPAELQWRLNELRPQRAVCNTHLLQTFLQE